MPCFLLWCVIAYDNLPLIYRWGDAVSVPTTKIDMYLENSLEFDDSKIRITNQDILWKLNLCCSLFYLIDGTLGFAYQLCLRMYFLHVTKRPVLYMSLKELLYNVRIYIAFPTVDDYIAIPSAEDCTAILSTEDCFMIPVCASPMLLNVLSLKFYFGIWFVNYT